MNERDLFMAAVQIDAAAERSAYLDRACAGETALRQRVEALLAAFEQAGSFLQQPAGDPRATSDASPPGPSSGSDPAEGPGTVVGPYKLIQQIGEGGMGTVWMAQQTEPVKRLVAVKLIKAGMDSRQVLARFEAERQALALMDHPNIARVLDAGTTAAGRPYFVMDLVEGVPITKYCDEHRLTPRQRLELFLPVCQAVQHAHQKGIIHRDLKPSNVLVALYDGRPVPKVIDFGVAKAAGQPLTDKTLVTGFGNLVGTLEYMSPEQAEVNQLDVDTRSDIYSLGVLLYELLTGSPPFSRKESEKGGMLEMLRVIREREPTRPSAKLSTAEGLPTLAANRGTEPAKLTKLVRGELDWIVMKALDKDRARRYETANGFAADVQRYLHDEPVLACPPSAGYRLRKFVRRNKAALAMASVLTGALVVAVVGLSVSNLLVARERDEKTKALSEKVQALANESAALTKATEQEGRANERAEEAKKQQAIARKQELLARRRFYAAQTNLALQAWEAGQPARALELLESLRPKLDQEDLRGFDWYYLWRLCHRNLHRTMGAPGEVVHALAVTPDGKTLVSGSRDASVRVWDVATGKERAVLTGHKACVWRLAISPDGKVVASASNDNTVKLWDLGTGELLATLPVGGAVRSVDFSPDGKALAAGTEDGTLELWDVGARQRRLTLQAHFAPTVALDYSPDGKLLATGAGWNTSRGPGGVKVWDVTSEPPRIVSQVSPSIFVAFSPDGRLLATCHFQGVKVWSVPSGELKARLDSFKTRVESVAFSADGSTLAFGGGDRTVKLWDFGSGATRTVGAHLGSVDAVAVVPQGDLLASGSNDGTVKVWHADPPQDAAGFAHDSAVRSLAFTPDGKLLVVGSDLLTSVLDAATGKERTTLPVGGVLVASADANLLATGAPDDKGVIWDVAAARARAVLPVGPGLAGAAFSPDGKTLVTWVADREQTASVGVRLWDLGTSRVRLTLKLGFDVLHCAAFSPDGRTLATGRQGGAVTLWDPTTGRQRMTLQQREGATIDAFAVAFSNDGKVLAAGNNQGGLRLWDVETGQLKVSFKGHTDAIRSVAFSPDDRTLLSGSADRTARLWDVVTGQELLTLKGHKSPVHRVAFAPDGKRLATASPNAVKLWLAATESEATAFRMELDPDDPDSPRATNNWGDRLLEMHRPREAEKAYRKALARLEQLAAALPDTPDYRDELAYCLLVSSLITESPPERAEFQRRFAEIWRTLPADRQLQLRGRVPPWGSQLRAAGRFQEALRVQEQLTELIPGSPWAWFQLAYTHEASGQPAKAIAAYSRAIEADPTHVPSWNNRGALYDRLGRRDEALADYRQAVALDPGDPVSNAHLGSALRARGELDEAVAVYRKAIEADPTFADAYNGLAWLLAACPDARFRDPGQAVALARKAVELAPEHPYYLRTLGVACYRAGDWKAAVAALGKSVELRKGGDSRDWLFLAMAHWQLGEKDKAREWYDRAVQGMDKNQPTDEELRRFRAEAAELLGLNEKK
jgi:WD40 repeat protein/serine/threonine protein kinase/Flp pilus assembly protein TadD